MQLGKNLLSACLYRGIVFHWQGFAGLMVVMFWAWDEKMPTVIHETAPSLIAELKYSNNLALLTSTFNKNILDYNFCLNFFLYCIFAILNI